MGYKPYYKIKELTEKRWKKLGLTVEDIVERVAIEGLSLYLFFPGVALKPDGINENKYIFHKNLFAKLPEDTIKELSYSSDFHVQDVGVLLPKKKKLFVTGYVQNDKFTVLEYTIFKKIIPKTMAPQLISIEDLFLIGIDVEKLDSELTNEYSLAESMAKLLNPSSNWYSEELALAVRAWIDLYQNRPGSRFDREYKPQDGGHGGIITDWLKNNAPEIKGSSAKARFITIVNPDKSGGIGTTPGN